MNTLTATRACPKCGFEPEIEVLECPRCQIVFDKYSPSDDLPEPDLDTPSDSMSLLAGADELLVRQLVERLEMFTGIETVNRYQVMDPQGDILFHAEEESGGVGGFLTRNLLKAMRPFTIRLAPSEGVPALTLKSPFRFFFHEVEILDADGRTLGSVRREFSVFSRRYTVTCRSNPRSYTLHGPAWHPWTFKIMDHDRECGRIAKCWSGLAKELFSDADHFGISFPASIDGDFKAVFLGAVFLIDFVHFEENSGN